VEWSNELRNRVLEPGILEAVRIIDDEARGGIDLNQRLTRGFFKCGFNDRLLNDLGIQHLHLGSRSPTSCGQAIGTKELLFVIVQPQRLLFVDVLDHCAFREGDFLAIVNANWPEILASCRRDLFGSNNEIPTPAERAAARESGVTVLTASDQEVFAPPGGGIATDGTSLQALDQAAVFLHRIRNYYNWIATTADCIAEQLREQAGINVSTFNLTVRLRDSEIVFEDSNSNIVVYPEREEMAVRVRES
jgi:hypothetical protein